MTSFKSGSEFASLVHGIDPLTILSDLLFKFVFSVKLVVIAIRWLATTSLT